MRWVQHAALRPHRCAVVPFIGNANARKGFIDAGYDLPGWDPHVYVSVDAVEEMARLIGWQPKHVEAQATATINRQAGEIARLEQEVTELKRFREAAEYTLGQFGAKVRAKPGRKPAEKEKAVSG